MPMAFYLVVYGGFKFPLMIYTIQNDKDSNISQLEFCIQYLTWGVDRSRKEYWDNNDSANYKIDVVTNETRTGAHNRRQ
ncbi:AVN_HP_G0120100.mRNA.1.CDS.1 [Saccharomyces cerevisiae]|nr:AVN_HP_G0120100.mRNA.1.CDS.1 [Saccharomyces cerevisiae]CAI6997187.1 AVN_HP_G0120100.mRNA.1.CDS.1 [Saccharomyces cerevisiae]